MSFTEFQCPSCSARLRLRDRNQLLRTIPCPDCGEDLTLEPDGDKNVVATVASSDGENPALVSRQESRFDWHQIATPRNISLAVAALILLGFLFAIFWPSESQKSQDGGQQIAAQQNPVGQDDGKKIGNVDEPEDSAAPNGDGLIDVTPEPKDPLAGTKELLPNPTEPIPDPPKSVADPMPESPVVDGDKQTTAAPSEPVNPDPAAMNVDPKPKVPDAEPIPDPAELEKKRLAKIELRLDQKILSYEQPEPVALSRLLLEWEELSGVPVSFSDAVSEDAKQQPISVQLKDTTVRQVLEALLTETELVSSQPEPGKIVIDTP